MLRGRLRAQSGTSLTGMMVSIGVIVILMGIMSSGWIWVKRQAELTSLHGRAHQISTGLQLYYQRHRSFPDAYPAKLETDLASFVDDAQVFTSYADPEASVDFVNRQYITPVTGPGEQYVLSLNSVYAPEKAVVLFSDATTGVLDKLDVECNNTPATGGSVVKGRTITFNNGSSVELVGETETTIVQSFQAEDGTPIHILKQDSDKAGEIKVQMPTSADILVVASENGRASMRCGEVELTFSNTENQVGVKNVDAEVVVDGLLLPGEEIEDVPTGYQNLFGSLNINPNNSPNNEFILEKLDGTQITRDDLHASNGDLEYIGRATMIRVQPKGNGNQNTLTYNGQTYRVRNGRVYVITANWMACRVYNAKDNGTAMGHWWIDNLVAFGAQIVEVGPGNSANKGKGKGKGNQNDDPPPSDPEPEAEPEEDPVVESGPIIGKRTLGRGTSIPVNTTRSFTKYH